MRIFAPALIFCGATAFSQSPQVPHKMEFAGLTLTIRDDARREIQKDVDALTLHAKYFNIKAQRAKTYFPIIERVFAEERLPDDFKYLSLQESALVPDAVSSSDAVGFWQFKDFTAREVGLRVDSDVDERMNIESASRGAAKYLKQCNHYFNNWLFALQAYQMGAGGVLRVVGDRDLGGRHMEITQETYWYVKKFLAHKVAFENVMTGKAELEVTSLYSMGGKSLKQISKETSVDEQKLRDFNKWLKTDRVPTDKEYAILIPKGEGGPDFGVLVAASGKRKPEAGPSLPEKSEINGVPTIRANKGESIMLLANRGHIGIKAFLRYNEIGIDKPVVAGQSYFLAKKKKRATQELYTLKPGDDLWSVSQRFGVRQKSLRKFNRLQEQTRVSSGATLYLSNRKPGAISNEEGVSVALLNEDDSFTWDPPNARKTGNIEIPLEDSRVSGGTGQQTGEIQSNSTVVEAIHEVKASDTLYSVARQYGVTIKELMEWNDKKDLSISVGEKLKVRSH